MCYGGECIVQKKKKPIKVVKGGWSEWKSESCKSGCIEKSRGMDIIITGVPPMQYLRLK